MIVKFGIKIVDFGVHSGVLKLALNKGGVGKKLLGAGDKGGQTGAVVRGGKRNKEFDFGKKGFIHE